MGAADGDGSALATELALGPPVAGRHLETLPGDRLQEVQRQGVTVDV